MRLLAIVPARGGSKRLPNKNLSVLNGKPLMWHTLEAVNFGDTSVILSSDSEDILNIGRKYGNITCLKREKKLATDESTVLETVVDIVENKGYDDYEAVGLFLPTAPLRDKKHVMEAVTMLSKTNYDGIISTTDYEFPPSLGLVLGPDNDLHCYDHNLPFLTGNTRSQDHNKVIRPNGAIYIKRMKEFKRDKNFFKGRVTNYHMNRDDSIDIDTLLDLKIAELMMKEL